MKKWITTAKGAVLLTVATFVGAAIQGATVEAVECANSGHTCHILIGSGPDATVIHAELIS